MMGPSSTYFVHPRKLVHVSLHRKRTRGVPFVLRFVASPGSAWPALVAPLLQLSRVTAGTSANRAVRPHGVKEKVAGWFGAAAADHPTLTPATVREPRGFCLRRERICPRPNERLPESRNHHQVGVPCAAESAHRIRCSPHRSSPRRSSSSARARAAVSGRVLRIAANSARTACASSRPTSYSLT